VSTASSGPRECGLSSRALKWLALPWDANLESRSVTLIQLDKVARSGTASRPTVWKTYIHTYIHTYVC
jgi:hypothetical protein